jgi:transposase-like protein
VGRRGYPPEFRRRVLDWVEAGRTVAEVAADLGISQQTIYSWRRQNRIDRGLEAGPDDRREGGARKRIREREAELVVHRRATELLKEQAGHVPRPGQRRSGRPGTAQLRRLPRRLPTSRAPSR